MPVVCKTAAGRNEYFRAIFKKIFCVSHQPERTEKNCLNCGTQVLGPYCQACGQKNTVVHQSFWQLVTHFVYDIFHFDGKFFDTLKYLLFKPGFVPKEYVRGRRFSYLDPIRMYLFTSAVFFLVFFSLSNADTGFIKFNSSEPLSAAERTEAIENLKKEMAENPADTALSLRLNQLQDTTTALASSDITDITAGKTINSGGREYASVAHYDSIQQSLPAGKQDNWFQKKMLRKVLATYTAYNYNIKEILKHFGGLFIHKLPYLLFISLPFFALILKLLYMRRKTYYYSDHAVFTLYHYIFSFILQLLVFFLSALSRWTQIKLFQNLISFLILAWIVYLFIAMKRFYGQGWLKTFSKFLLLNLIGIIVLLLLFAIFLFLTIFQL